MLFKAQLNWQKNPDNDVIYFAANAEVDECLQSNDAIKVVCIDTPHIANNKNKIKASLYGIWNGQAKTEFAKLLSDLDPKHTVFPDMRPVRKCVILQSG